MVSPTMSDPFDLADYAPEPGAAAHSPPAIERGYLSTLNTDQRDAVDQTEGPVLVLAGAGTGKTRVLTARLAHILDGGLAFPGETLTVTFTNKAAREMKDRVERLLGRSVEGWYLGTFHAMGARILRRHAELVGLKSNFTIIDTDDQIRLLKQIILAEDIDEKKWPARVLAGIVSRWKDRGLTPDKLSDGDEESFANGRAGDLYRQYQQRLTTLNAADFGDLLLHNLTVFQADPEILRGYQARFKYILVDEYQDTNVSQYLWLRLLAQGHRNICCVGDDDQSVYAWRGAEVGNILRFEKDFPGAQIVRLEQNYRSTPQILGAASGLITHNQGRLGKTLWTEQGGGEPVTVKGVWDGNAEAREVAATAESLQTKGHALADMAILVRTGFQTRAFEERFIQIGMPYRVVGGLRFYERQEIRDAIAYLRVLAVPDDDLAFERIVNRPKRGLGAASLQVLTNYSRANNCSLIHAAGILVGTDELRGKARSSFTGLLNDFDRWRTMAMTMPLSELTGTVLDESGYTGMLQADKSVEAPGRLENLKELVSALEEFESLEEFLEHVSLVMENERDGSEDKINIMTLHAAKGLEFDTVFLPGWEDGLFPNQRALDEGGTKALEEERRLGYVGLTRARLRAYVLYAANRNLYGRWVSAAPSRFVAELPDAHVDRSADMGAGFGAGGFAAHASAALGGGAWGGAQDRNPRRRQIDLEAVTMTAHAPGTFSVGQRVFHQKFGYGQVEQVDGSKLEIVFDKAGRKKVVDSFVSVAEKAGGLGAAE